MGAYLPHAFGENRHLLIFFYLNAVNIKILGSKIFHIIRKRWMDGVRRYVEGNVLDWQEGRILTRSDCRRFVFENASLLSIQDIPLHVSPNPIHPSHSWTSLSLILIFMANLCKI